MCARSLSLSPSLWPVIPHWHFHKCTFINFIPPVPSYASVEGGRRRWIDGWVLTKPAWIWSQGVTKFFKCRTDRTWRVIDMCAIKVHKINNRMILRQVQHMSRSICEKHCFMMLTEPQCTVCISAYHMLPPSLHLFYSSKDESYNLYYKSNNTIKGVMGKAIQKVNILCARFLPLVLGN